MSSDTAPDASPVGPLPPHASSLGVGSKIRLVGLLAKPELNGLFGEIIGPEEDGRFPVRLAGSSTGGLKVKPANLRKGTPGGAGGPVNMLIDEEERKRIPLPRNVKKLLAFVVDPSTSDGAKSEKRTTQGLKPRTIL